jgi:hypothetical protein
MNQLVQVWGLDDRVAQGGNRIRFHVIGKKKEDIGPGVRGPGES